jgi:TusA-related sulfurtransferase
MKYKRRTILIDREVQLRIAGRVVIYWCAAILFVILPLAFYKTFTIADSLFVNNLAAVANEHAAVFSIMLLLLPLAVYDSIKLSHRFTGPIYRLRKELQRIKNGEVVTIRFRDDDFWTDLPDSINALVSKIDDLETQVAEELSRDSVTY